MGKLLIYKFTEGSYLNIVNFGFGDEMDDDYKLIENIDDNEL
jgi:hypothetical protein